MQYKIEMTEDALEGIIKWLTNHDSYAKNFEDFKLRTERDSDDIITEIVVDAISKHHKDEGYNSLLIIPITTTNNDKRDLGELFDEYEEKGFDFFDINYLLREANYYSNSLENEHARSIMYSLMKELMDSQEKLQKIRKISTDGVL